ncbi:hypothetical protein Ssi02_38340 [Sinosporangium siamense]|uniref:Uncharacterized protein n=1 Tax=Sinosporangium siamense TaxID=1367973 RepID=A0A919V7M8_9ACTN|nr:hypothetical protein Ssi02_38340 [Sinosporangium siamense]
MSFTVAEVPGRSAGRLKVFHLFRRAWPDGVSAGRKAGCARAWRERGIREEGPTVYSDFVRRFTKGLTWGSSVLTSMIP